ncbi:Protein canopy 3 [Amphibalanus amphitrite]|uniref:glutathione-specific gamma-glutamylcyclotransferase n=1 Tax=Amphibalanus amphitrite TaxID=1232801 RepID=A0A6A4XDA8_AMPAM|nr:Protein canopy 3 [Amphibalanus amphitrite]
MYPLGMGMSLPLMEPTSIQVFLNYKPVVFQNHCFTVPFPDSHFRSLMPLPAGDCCSEEWSSSRDPRSEVAQESDRGHLWVFGYGSLCWKPGFSYRERRIGRVEGFSRRFWQGSVTHRGTPQQGITWGCAFLVTDRAALRYLDGREVVLGGYQTRRVPFVPREPGRPPFAVTIYLATERNPLWLGEAPLARLAAQVAAARGRCGPNADYVLQLVRFMKRELRLLEVLEDVCEGILLYNVHKERTDSTRFAKGRSQTFQTLHNLVDKGVKVDLGIPHELWDKPSAEITDLKNKCDALIEDFEEVITQWYNEYQEAIPLSTFLCSRHVLAKDDDACLSDPPAAPVRDEL